MRISTTTISVFVIVGGMFMAAAAPTSAYVGDVCGPGAGDCCSANGTPGCESTKCCQCICADDPFCCDNQWDSICATSAADPDTQCATVCQPCQCGNGLCQPGISENCETCPTDCGCGGSPFICVEGECVVACDIPDAGACCEPNDTPGCNDGGSNCCLCICLDAGLESCCTDQWGPECVEEAQNPNGICADKCLTCLCGDGECQPLEDCASCPEDCGVPADLNADGVVNAADLALLLGAWGPCE